jgi:hypothetical protein
MNLAPWEGFEPPTRWLTATCSTTELPRKKLPFAGLRRGPPANEGGVITDRFPPDQSRLRPAKRESKARGDRLADRICAAKQPAPIGREENGYGGAWRPRGESNSRCRICSPVHYHFATRPSRARLNDCLTLARPSSGGFSCRSQGNGGGRRHIGRGSVDGQVRGGRP